MDNAKSDFALTFQRWMEELDFDTLRAAAVLGKRRRIIEMYAGGRAPPVSTRKLMAAIYNRDGKDIDPWPLR